MVGEACPSRLHQRVKDLIEHGAPRTIAHRTLTISRSAEAQRSSDASPHKRGRCDRLDEDLETVSVGENRGCSKPSRLVRAMRLKDGPDADRVTVVKCPLFATNQCGQLLEITRARNIKSPFSNIRAISHKLSTALPNHPAFDSRAVVTSP